MPKQPPPRKKIITVQIRASDLEPGDVAWLAKGPRQGAWRLISNDIIEHDNGMVDVRYLNQMRQLDTIMYGKYDLVKLQVERDL